MMIKIKKNIGSNYFSYCYFLYKSSLGLKKLLLLYCLRAHFFLKFLHIRKLWKKLFLAHHNILDFSSVNLFLVFDTVLKLNFRRNFKYILFMLWHFCKSWINFHALYKSESWFWRENWPLTVPTWPNSLGRFTFSQPFCEYFLKLNFLQKLLHCLVVTV